MLIPVLSTRGHGAETHANDPLHTLHLLLLPLSDDKLFDDKLFDGHLEPDDVTKTLSQMLRS